MSDPVLIALISNIALVIVSVFVSYGNRRKLNEVHTATNGRMDQLLEAVKVLGRSEGVAQEKKDQARRDEQSRNP